MTIEEEKEAVKLIVLSSKIQDLLRADLEEEVIPTAKEHTASLIVPNMKTAGRAVELLMKAIKMVPDDVWARLGQELGSLVGNILAKKLGGGGGGQEVSASFDKLKLRGKAANSFLSAEEYVSDRLIEAGFADPYEMTNLLLSAVKRTIQHTSPKRLKKMSSYLREHESDLEMYWNLNR